jgi:hypothetical protein
LVDLYARFGCWHANPGFQTAIFEETIGIIIAHAVIPAVLGPTLSLIVDGDSICSGLTAITVCLAITATYRSIDLDTGLGSRNTITGFQTAIFEETIRIIIAHAVIPAVPGPTLSFIVDGDAICSGMTVITVRLAITATYGLPHIMTNFRLYNALSGSITVPRLSCAIGVRTAAFIIDTGENGSCNDNGCNIILLCGGIIRSKESWLKV